MRGCKFITYLMRLPALAFAPPKMIVRTQKVTWTIASTKIKM